MSNHGRILCRALAALGLIAALNAWAAPAGTIQFAAGDVKIRNAAGVVRAAVKGGTVDEGDAVLTGPSASAQLKMTDGGILAVRPETELKLDTYRYSGKEDGNERAVMSLAKGGFRTITGVIGRTNKQNYTVNTPTGTIGIRGTDHEPVVIPVIAGPGKQAIPPGTYDKVNVGQAYIRTPAGEVNIRPNQVGYAAPGQAPTLLPRVPEFFKATPPVRQAQLQSEGELKQETAQAATGASNTAAASSSTSVSETTAATAAARTSSGTDTVVTASATNASTTTVTTATPSTSTTTGATTTATTSSGTESSTTSVATATSTVAPTSVIPAATSTTVSSGTSTSVTSVTTTSVATTSTATPTATTTVAPATVTQTVTGTSTSGNSLAVDLTGQTVTTASGTTADIGTTESINSTTRTTVLTAYYYQNNSTAQNRNTIYKATGALNPLIDTSGNLIEITDEDGLELNKRQLTLTGGKRGSTAANATHYASTGIVYGWSAPPLHVAGRDADGTFSNRKVLDDGLSWIRGPGPVPFYLPGVLTGTATYTLDGAIARDHNGTAGTVNSASLAVNFTAMSVNLGLNVSTTGNTWVATATNVKMDDAGEFSAYTSSDTTTPTGVDSHRKLTLTRNGSSATTVGAVQGQLMGTGLNGAGLTYSFSDSLGTQRASGTAAFFGPTQSSTTSYYILGMLPGMSSLGATSNDENTPLLGGFLSGSRTQFSGSYPVRMDAEYRFLGTPTSCTGCTKSVMSIQGVYAVPGATGATTIGTAALTNNGMNADTGIVWGRYGGTAGATIGINDRISGASLGTLDVSKQSMHFIASGLQSQALALPVSGTANYTLVGNTNPTDNLGNVGTLGSATLTANFTAKTVDAAVNLTVAGNAWAAKATSLAITDGVFEAKRTLAGAGALTVTKNASSVNTSGQLAGAFTGTTGQGVAMLYSLNQGGHSNAGGTTVSGVAAFKR